MYEVSHGKWCDVETFYIYFFEKKSFLVLILKYIYTFL